MDRTGPTETPARVGRANRVGDVELRDTPRGTGVDIGKIVRSESHVRYTCQIYGPGETATPPAPEDYAFGSFVRIPLRSGSVALTPPDALTGPGDVQAYRQRPIGVWAVGLIYDTILMNPAFGAMGPRLSNDAQVELFSPDYVAERAVLVSALLLGTVERDASGRMRVAHGVPALAPDLGAVVSPLGDASVRAFHEFADEGGDGKLYLHMGYLPHAIQEGNPLLPMAILRVTEHLETLFPERRALLGIVRRNFAWKLKVQPAG